MRVITGLYDDYATAQSVVGDLEDAGINSDDISIVGHNSHNDTNAAEGAGVGAGIGAAVGGAGGLLAGLGLLAIPGVGPVVAAGWLAATAAGAVGGAVVGGAAGGLIGALTNSGVSEEDAHVYAEGVRRGGTLVTVRVPEEQYAVAQSIVSQSNVNLEQRRSQYAEEGWESFDGTAKPYTVEEIEAERLRFR